MTQTTQQLQGIPTPTRNGNKIEGEFYPLTPSYTQQLRKAKLTAAEWRIWSYLVSLDPWGNKYQDLNTLTIMSECNCSKATFYRAIAKLQALNLFDFQDKGFCFKNEMGAERLRKGYLKNETGGLKNESESSKMRKSTAETPISSRF